MRRRRQQNNIWVYILVFCFSLFAFYLGKSQTENTKVVELQASLDLINHEIKVSEKYLKFLKKLKKEKETQLVLLTY